MVSGGNASSLPLVGGKPEPTIKELSSPGRRASKFPKLDVPEVKINHESLKKEKARPVSYTHLTLPTMRTV